MRYIVRGTDTDGESFAYIVDAMAPEAAKRAVMQRRSCASQVDISTLADEILNLENCLKGEADITVEPPDPNTVSGALKVNLMRETALWGVAKAYGLEHPDHVRQIALATLADEVERMQSEERSA